MQTALIVIDVQKEYQAGGALCVRGFDKAAANILRLFAWARAGNADILHVRHVSSNPEDDDFCVGTPGVNFAVGFEPHDGEGVFTKSLPSAFSAPSFKALLKDKGYKRLVICGFSSFLCCDSTSREAFHRGYEVIFAEDAIGEFAFSGLTEENLHQYTCAVQGIMFARIMKTAAIIESHCS